ncbi:MAG: pilus assembly protein TadE [Chloroflexota bacterium]
MPAAHRRPGERVQAARDLGGREHGVALVELAMVLPLLLVLVFGIIDFGRAFQTWITLTNAAREGARLGTVSQDAQAVRQRCESTAGVSGVSCSVSGLPGMTGQDVTVTANYTLQFITPVGSLISLLGGQGMQTSFNMSASATMRIE